MIKEMISTITAAKLVINFIGTDDGDVSALIVAPDVEYPRGAATHKNPEVALTLAAARGLASIYHRVNGGFISLEEKYDEQKD